MFKAVLTIAALGVLLLLIAIIILVSLNWSDKFYGPLTALVAALTGTVAALIVVFAMLKGETFGNAFTTFIIVYTDNHLPVSLNDVTRNNSGSAENPTSLMYRLEEVSNLATHIEVDKTGNEIVLFEPPHNDSDETPFYEELLQHAILMKIIDMQNPNPWTTQKFGNKPGFSVGKKDVYTITDITREPIINVVNDISNNRFSRNPVEQHRMKTYLLRLPVGTKIELRRIEPSGDWQEEKRLLLLIKPHFFTLEIIIKPNIPSETTSLPASSGITGELAKQCKTLAFEISMKANFERLTTGNSRNEGLKGWARWVFDQLERKFSDSTPEG